VEIALVLIWNVHIAAKISAHWIFVKIGKVETYLEVEHFPFVTGPAKHQQSGGRAWLTAEREENEWGNDNALIKSVHHFRTIPCARMVSFVASLVGGTYHLHYLYYL
jgi:hypothetical protein